MIEPKYKIGEVLYIPFIDHKRTGLVLRVQEIQISHDSPDTAPHYVLDFLCGDIRYFKVDQIDNIEDTVIAAYTPTVSEGL